MESTRDSDRGKDRGNHYEPWYARLARPLLAHPESFIKIMPALVSLAALAFVSFLVWHGISVEIPRIQSNFHVEMQAEREMFRAELRMVRDEMKLQREQDDRRTEKLVAAIERDYQNTKGIWRLIEDALRDANRKPQEE